MEWHRDGNLLFRILASITGRIPVIERERIKDLFEK